MVLIALITGMALLKMGNANQSQQQQSEAYRLAKLLQLAEQEVMVRSDPIAVEFFNHGYRFLSPGPDQWQPIIEDTLFNPHDLGAQVQISLQQAQQPVFLKQQAGMTQRPEPQLVLTPDDSADSVQVLVLNPRTHTGFTVTNTEFGWTVLDMENPW